MLLASGLVGVCRRALQPSARAVEVRCVSVLERYDVRLGPLHLVATYLFKPLLHLNASFLLALSLDPVRSSAAVSTPPEPHFRLGLRFWLPATVIVASVYGSSFAINLDFPDWIGSYPGQSHNFLLAGIQELSAS